MSFGDIAQEKPEESYAQARNRLLKDEQPPTGRFRGTVAEVKGRGDFGKIHPAHGGASMYVYYNQLRGENQRLADGQVVEYREGTYKDKPQAKDVDILLEPE